MGKTQSSSQEKRQERIIELVQRDGHVRVSELSEILNVSEITIRRDLILLEKSNLIERTFGGATATMKFNKEDDYYTRYKLALEAKDSIAKLAAELIEENDTVFINGGSTTSHLFRYINRNKVRIVTTNAGCIGQITNPSIELILAGGHYRLQSNSFFGGFTNNILDEINANKAILGVDALSCLYGMTAPSHQAAEITKMMINRTMGEIIVITDHRKIGMVSDFVTAPINRINTIVSDDQMDPDFIMEMEKMGIRVLLTKVTT
ncbi:MAG TPA: DeoR/GlpR transcriptional regulator [Spirochaeta sp.]|nr:DeoR/GlpR transcriptional regulator [Spirochaeta sp.]